jgi:hypothetical protein
MAHSRAKGPNVLEQIPEKHRAAAAAAVTAVFADTPIDSLNPVGPGMSQALVYRMVVQGRAYLLRIITHIEALNEPSRHVASLRAAAAAGLAPAVHHADPRTGVSIVDFVAARPLAIFERPRPAMIHDLAEAVARLQRLPPFPPFVDYLDAVDNMMTEVRATGLLPAAADELFERYRAVPAAYPRDPAAYVASHNDLNPTNVMWDGKQLWIVDWDAAFGNDRFVDPAIVCNFFGLGRDEEAQFLTTWLGQAPTERQWAQLHLMRLAAQMLFAGMMVKLAAAGGMKLPDSQAFGVTPLTHIRRNLATLLASPAGRLEVGLAGFTEVLFNLRAPEFPETVARVKGERRGPQRPGQ